MECGNEDYCEDDVLLQTGDFHVSSIPGKSFVPGMRSYKEVI